MQNTLRTTATQLKMANPIKMSKTNISQKKKHENGREEHEKVPNSISHQRNKCLNHNKVTKYNHLLNWPLKNMMVGRIVTLLHCWWKYKRAQPFEEMVVS